MCYFPVSLKEKKSSREKTLAKMVCGHDIQTHFAHVDKAYKPQAKDLFVQPGGASEVN